MASRTTTDPIDILLEMGIDLDNLSEEEDYLSALKEAIAIILVKTKGAGNDKSKVLLDEVVKVRKSRKDKDPKFKAKKTKISADSFKKGTATETAPQSIGQKALPSAIKPKTSIIPYQKPDEVDEEEEGGKKKKAKTRKKTNKDQNLLEGIAKSVSNIADILKKQYGLKKKKASNDAKKAEAEQRKLKESGLEKRFKGLSKVAEKVIAPVKGVIDRILDFFLNIIVGRFLVKFIEWFGDPKNKKKVDSVVRFLTDHGPKLLAAFLLFGTGIGRFTVRLSALLIKGALRLGAAAAKFALGFARRHPAAAAITAIVGGAAIAGAMQSKTPSNDPDAPEGRTQLEDTMDYGGVTGDPVAGAFSAGGIVPSYEEGGEIDFKIKQSKGEKESLISKLFGMTPTGMAIKGAKSAGSSVKKKGLGNAAMDFAGGAFGNLKGFMDEKGITDVLMQHPLAKMGAFGLGKGKEAFGNLKGFMDEKGITDAMMAHPFAKMGAFGIDKFMNFGKDPARDITGQSGQDVKGAGVDTQLISARPGDFVVNKKTASAMGPDYFDSISANTGEKVSGAGPDTQMIAVRPGEIVVNRETVGALGADHFLDLNRTFGGSGANKPKMAEVQAASGGGFVLPTFSTGGYVSGSEGDLGKRGTPNPKKEESSGNAGPISTPNKSSTGTVSKTDGIPVKSVSHPNTGSGFGIDGVTDYKGRPGVFSKGGAEAFAKMITDSSGQVKGSDIASSQRSKSYNAHVGGVSNSNHLFGNALDIHGTSQTWMRANGQKYGWIVNDYPGSHGGHFNYKGAGASQMNTPDEGSPVATGQGGRALGSTTQRGGAGLRSGGPGKSSIVLSLKNGIQGKLDTATGKFTPAEFSPAERARYTQFGGTIPETKPKAEPQNKLLGALKGAATGAALGGVFGGPLGALVGGVAGGVLGSGILSGQSDPNKPKRSDFPMGRSGAKEYASAMKNHKVKSSSTTGPSPEATKRHAELMATTDPSSQKRIVDYDAKHGEGAYSKELQKKLNKIYPAAKDSKSGSPVTPTGKVVGRENLPSATQKVLARMDAQKAGGLQPDMKTSGPALGRLAMGAFGGSLLGPAGMMGGALLGGGVENIMGNISNAMTQYGGNVKDGNIGTPTTQEQKDFDNLAAKREKLRVTEAKLGTTNKNLVTPSPPPGGGNNVKVVRAPSPGGGGNNPNDNQTGGSDVDATSPGNGNKAKWSILGIPMPL